MLAYKFNNRFSFVKKLFWLLFIYIIAALAWWFIALYIQTYKISDLQKQIKTTKTEWIEIEKKQRAKEFQYIGEGAIFLIFILAGAAYSYTAINREIATLKNQNTFMQGITHELKTPIAVTQLNLQTILKHNNLDEQVVKKLLNNSLQETNRLSNLCNNLLLAAQIEDYQYAIKKTEFNIIEKCKNIVNIYKARFPQRQIIFEQKITHKQNINTDELLFEITINNLLDNAIKYSPEDKPINLTLSEQEQNKIIITVADQGKGLTHEEKKMVFIKYKRLGNKATQNSKGTGLGLYLVSRICQLAEYDIKIKDNLPNGSIFILTI